MSDRRAHFRRKGRYMMMMSRLRQQGLLRVSVKCDGAPNAWIVSLGYPQKIIFVLAGSANISDISLFKVLKYPSQFDPDQ